MLVPCQMGFWRGVRVRSVSLQSVKGVSCLPERKGGVFTAELRRSACASASRCPCGVSGSAVLASSLPAGRAVTHGPGAGCRPARKYKGCSWCRPRPRPLRGNKGAAGGGAPRRPPPVPPALPRHQPRALE